MGVQLFKARAQLERLTEEATGKTVIALPIEATALGNLKIQMMR